MFTAALFTRAKTWKQPTCPVTDEWKIDLVYIPYSTINKNGILPYAATWMDPEMIILSEVRERHISYDITYQFSSVQSLSRVQLFVNS